MKKIIMIFLLILTTAGLSAQSSAPKELAAAERAFAAAALRMGINAAFLEYLDDDAVMFNPGPVNGKELYRSRKERPITLHWRPTFVQVARSGDYGISTGPWEITPAGSDSVTAVGEFFSVWKKRKDGVWRVILDNGVSYPVGERTSEKESFSMLVSSKSRKVKGMNEERMMKAEGSFAAALITSGAGAAYGRFTAEDVRLLRNGNEPARTKQHAQVMVKKDPQWKRIEATAHSIASSHDMGFIHGLAVSATNDSATFIRVWKYDDGWRIAADVLEPYHQR